MSEFSFIRLYLPAEGRTAIKSNGYSVLLNLDCIEWLNENVGTRANTYHEWILGLPENTHGWYYLGFDHDPASGYCKTARVFLFRNESHALMFKLAWGG